MNTTIKFVYSDGSYTQYELVTLNTVCVRSYDGKSIYTDGYITKSSAMTAIKKLVKSWERGMMK